MRVASTYFPRFAVAEINRKQTDIAELQSQIASGKQLLRPSDDPARFASTESLDGAIARMDQFTKNTLVSQQRLTQQEGVYNNVIDSLQRLKELAITAGSDVMNDQDRSAIAAEARQLREQLIDYANSRTPDGDYLFAGQKVGTRPFADAGGTVRYYGDQTRNYVQISDARKVPVNDTGDAAFMQVPAGNGTYTTRLDPANAGSALIEDDTVVDSGAWRNGRYTIEFSAPDRFSVIDSDSGATVLGDQPYHAGEAVTFDGIRFRISGKPQAGDRLYIEPAGRHSVFDVADRLLAALDQPRTTPAEQARARHLLDGAIGELDQALEHFQALRSDLGGRMNYVDRTAAENDSLKYMLEKSRSEAQDTDYAAAVSKLEYQMSTLEAVRKTYLQLGNLSLFSYFR